MSAEISSLAEHTDLLQYLLSGLAVVVGLLIKRDVSRIEKRGDIAMTTLYGTPEDPSSGVVTRLKVVEQRCDDTHGDAPRRRSSDRGGRQ